MQNNIVFDRLVPALHNRGFSDDELKQARNAWATATGNHPPCPECVRRGKVGRTNVDPAGTAVTCAFCGAIFTLCAE